MSTLPTTKSLLIFFGFFLDLRNFRAFSYKYPMRKGLLNLSHIFTLKVHASKKKELGAGNITLPRHGKREKIVRTRAGRTLIVCWLPLTTQK